MFRAKRSVKAKYASRATAKVLRARGTESRYGFTEYFENQVLRKRPYIKKEWCTRVLQAPLRSEPQESNRYRFWGRIDEMQGRYLRVVTLSDRVTVHNAFFDRRFRP